MTIPIGVELEAQNAIQDAKDIIDERGNDIIVQTTNEANVERDIYGAIKKRTTTNYTWHAYPVTFSPTKDQLEEAGIKENVDVLVVTAIKDWTDNSLDYKSVDNTRWEIILNGETYTISHKNQINMFSHYYLNIVLGLFKK